MAQRQRFTGAVEAMIAHRYGPGARGVVSFGAGIDPTTHVPALVAVDKFVTRSQRSGRTVLPQAQRPAVAGGFAKQNIAADQYTVQVVGLLTDLERNYLTYLGRRYGVQVAIINSKPGAHPTSVIFR